MKEGSERLIELLRNAKRILVFTGAGVSTGSGISDFRGPRGVWKRRQPVYYQDFLTSETARVEYWDQKLEAWGTFRQAQPNAVHLAIADLEKANQLSMVVTQNIDGLHARAGTSLERLVELHGTNQWIECQSCSKRSDPAPHMESFRKTRRSPRCDCGGYLKPATISFGQNLRENDLERAHAAVSTTDLVIALGSTLSVYPAASFPLAAAERGVPYVIINQGETDHDSHLSVTLRFEGDVTDIFPPAVASALGSDLRR
jgi:NAD-dependent deacetylase